MFVNREPLCGVLSRVCVYFPIRIQRHTMKWICALVGEYLYAKVALSNNNTKKTRSKRNRLTEMTLRFDKSMRYSSFPTEAEKNGERETIHKLKHLPLLLLFAFIMWYNADTFYHFDGFFNAY